MVEKDNFSIGIIADNFRSVLGGEPSLVLIVPGSKSNPCFVSTQRHNYIIKSLRVQIKDQSKFFEWTEKNLPSLFILRRGNFAETSDSYLAIGKDYTLVWGSILSNVELDLTAFAIGTDDNPRLLAIRAYFPAMPEGAERKNSDGFVAVTRDPRIIVDWEWRIKTGLNTPVDRKEEPPYIKCRHSMGQGEPNHVEEKES